MIPITIIISFVLDSIVSNFISINTLFAPLFTLMSLIIVYPYFNYNHKHFIITAFITGMAYDLIYTNTIIIHGLLFIAIAFLIIKLNVVFSNNYLNVVIMAIISIIVYRLISYGLLLITNNISFNWIVLLKSIYQSLLINIIYILLTFMITDRISFALRIKKSDWLFLYVKLCVNNNYYKYVAIVLAYLLINFLNSFIDFLFVTTVLSIIL